MKINLIKTANGKLWPSEDEDAEKLNSIKTGEVYICDIKLNQNYRLHSKIFGFFKFCTQHYYGDIEPTPPQVEFVRKRLTVFAGYYDQVFTRDGDKFELVAKSLKYESMKPEERGEFYKAATDAALKHVFDRCDDKNTINQLLSWF